MCRPTLDPPQPMLSLSAIFEYSHSARAALGPRGRALPGMLNAHARQSPVRSTAVKVPRPAGGGARVTQSRTSAGQLVLVTHWAKLDSFGPSSILGSIPWTQYLNRHCPMLSSDAAGWWRSNHHRHIMPHKRACICGNVCCYQQANNNDFCFSL